MADAIAPLNLTETAAQESQAAHDGYILRVLIAADCLGNVALGGCPDETISTDTALLDRKHQFVGKIVSHILDLFQPNHGAGAAAGDLQRAQAEVDRLNACSMLNQ